MLKLQAVTKKFNNKVVLNNLNLEIEDGAVFGLVGINGAGKSTLLRSIVNIYDLDEGHIIFNDIDTSVEPSIRKDIIYVSDDPYYASNSTMKDLYTFYRTFYDFNDDDYYKYLNIFKLDPNKQISSFSKGMKRQVSLCFALAIKPKLLLLDEAFDGLDPLVRLHFKKALSELIEDKDITIIISSHNLKELEDICDSYGILENGQINTYGDLLDAKDSIKKYQVAFKDEYTINDFKDFDIMHYKTQGRVHTLVIKGDSDEIKHKLEAMNPLILDILSINFEELFIYEMEKKGELYE